MTPPPAGPPQPAATPVRLQFGEFLLDETDARLTRDGAAVPVTPRAFAVLCTLARSPGTLVTKQALLDAVWGHRFVSESVLKTAISELRTALGDDAKAPRYLETAARRGYRFIATIAAAQPADSRRPGDAAQCLPATHLIGRRQPIERLRSAWASAQTGARRICWVAGDAGVGKTTLVDHFVESLGAVRIARGQCVERYGAGEPYLPVLDALGELLRIEPDLASLLRRVAPTWALQLPWLLADAERQALRTELGSATQERMLRELGEYLERLTTERPLILITEDLHWSDQATVQLLNHVARRRAPAKLFWLATFRLAEVVADDHPLNAVRHELRAHHLCEELVLDTFTEQETADFIVARAEARTVPDSVVRTLHARTDGLPLFLAAVVDELLARDATANDSWLNELAVSDAVPESLAGIVARQMSDCDQDTRRVLDAASVCGDEFAVSTLATVLDRTPGVVQGICDELARRGRWLRTPAVVVGRDGTLDARVKFRHALYRHVIYQRLGSVVRADFHRRIAAVLHQNHAAGLPVAAVELATHRELGHEPLAAMQCFARASEDAIRQFAPEDAMALAERALALIAETPEGLARDFAELASVALHGSASTQILGVSSVQARRDFERARALLARAPDHPLRPLVLHGLGLVLMTRGEYLRAVEVATDALALHDQHDDPSLLLSACSVLGQVHALQGAHLVALEWLGRGIAGCTGLQGAVARDAFVVDPAVTLHATSALPLLHLGFAERARESYRLARARAEQLGEPMALMVAAWFGAMFHVRVGEVDTVAKLAEEMRQTVERAALAQGQLVHRWFHGWALAQRGQPREGYAMIRAAFDANRALGMLAGGSEVLGYAAEACLLAGDLAEAEAELRAALTLAAELDERAYVAQLELLAARVQEANGDRAAAQAARNRALAEARAQGAVWTEMLALDAICAADGTDAAWSALREALERVPEGQSTAPQRHARSTLSDRTAT